jgi:hypothetical protein
MAKVGRGSDQFPLRLPEGLRDRIKAYAEEHGRSMNAEIVRILEAKFPEPISFERRMALLLDQVRRFAEGQSPDSQLARLEKAMYSALMDVVGGHVDDVDDATRERISSVLKRGLVEGGPKPAETESKPPSKRPSRRKS